MIIYQASNEMGLQSFPTLREAKEHIKAQELPGQVYRIEIEFNRLNFYRAIDQQGIYAREVQIVWEW